jgi:hypothetical protein
MGGGYRGLCEEGLVERLVWEKKRARYFLQYLLFPLGTVRYLCFCKHLRRNMSRNSFGYWNIIPVLFVTGRRKTFTPKNIRLRPDDNIA